MPRSRQADAGYTMLEVLMAMLVAMIGLLGTVAVQQTLLNANANANDGAVALRLASQAMEEFNARVVMPGTPPIDRMAAVATGAWSAPAHVDSGGRPAPAASGTARWVRRTRVTDLGPGQPYNLSVEVSYALDSGSPKVVQLDMERRK
jgi:type II secretory pathway pseudopilin PulG